MAADVVPELWNQDDTGWALKCRFLQWGIHLWFLIVVLEWYETNVHLFQAILKNFILTEKKYGIASCCKVGQQQEPVSNVIISLMHMTLLVYNVCWVKCIKWIFAFINFEVIKFYQKTILS